MELRELFGRDPWAMGLRLGLLNLALAAVCSVTFLGTLYAVTLLSQQRIAARGTPAAEVPFPYPLLFLLFAAMFLAAWVRFGRRLRGAHRSRVQVALVGAGPLFGLSLLGYAGTVMLIILNAVEPALDLAPSVFVGGALATLILCAALSCVAVVVWSGDDERGAA